MNEFNKESLEFRFAAKKDADEIAALVNSVYRGENAKKGWTTEADILDGIRINSEKVNELICTENNVILMILSGNEIIGCVHLEKKGKKSHLGMLSVNVNYQNSGIGKLLLNKIEEYSKEVFGCDEMEMKVIGQRTELIDYYLRRGYVKTGEKEQFLVNTHFGEPKANDLYFEYLVKKL